MKGVFVGLATLDMIHYVEQFPLPDEKIQALDRWLGAGGPATNAAIAFAALGGEAQLVTALGDSRAAKIVREDLKANGVAVSDVAHRGDLAVSSIVVDESGRRTVVSVNAAGFTPPFTEPSIEFEDAAVMLVDGHNVDAAIPLLDRAMRAGVPAVLDGGSRKPRTEDLLKRVQYVIASSAFGGSELPEQTATALLRSPVRFAAVSAGKEPIVGLAETGPFTVQVPNVDAVDTLGAGDVLHGAFAYYLGSDTREPVRALERATVLASKSCTQQGPRIVL